MRLQREHWNAWAALCRQTIYLGYPREQPFYLPPRLGNTFEASAGPQLTEEDYTVGEMISYAWLELKNDRPTHASALKEFYGAYPNSPAKLKDRLLKLRMERRTAYRLVDESKMWIEGNVWHMANPRRSWAVVDMYASAVAK